jgi:hypothetical protein
LIDTSSPLNSGETTASETKNLVHATSLSEKSIDGSREGMRRRACRVDDLPECAHAAQQVRRGLPSSSCVFAAAAAPRRFLKRCYFATATTAADAAMLIGR